MEKSTCAGVADVTVKARTISVKCTIILNCPVLINLYVNRKSDTLTVLQTK